jgi:hypothetical protein
MLGLNMYSIVEKYTYTLHYKRLFLFKSVASRIEQMCHVVGAMVVLTNVKTWYLKWATSMEQLRVRLCD